MPPTGIIQSIRWNESLSFDEPNRFYYYYKKLSFKKNRFLFLIRLHMYLFIVIVVDVEYCENTDQIKDKYYNNKNKE